MNFLLARPKVFAFFCDPANLPRIMPPELQVRIEWAALVLPAADEALLIERDKAAGAGSEFIFSFRPLPLPIRINWRARIEEFEPDSYFRDTQVFGPMRRWSHRHEFQTESRDGTEGTLSATGSSLRLGMAARERQWSATLCCPPCKKALRIGGFRWSVRSYRPKMFRASPPIDFPALPGPRAVAPECRCSPWDRRG